MQVKRPRIGSTGWHGERAGLSPTSHVFRDTAENDWYFWIGTDGFFRWAGAETAEGPGFDWNAGGNTISYREGPDGTAAYPARTYSADNDLGPFRLAANNEGFSAGGVMRWDYNTTRMKLTNGYALHFGDYSRLTADGGGLHVSSPVDFAGSASLAAPVLIGTHRTIPYSNVQLMEIGDYYHTPANWTHTTNVWEYGVVVWPTMIVNEDDPDWGAQAFDCALYVHGAGSPGWIYGLNGRVTNMGSGTIDIAIGVVGYIGKGPGAGPINKATGLSSGGMIVGNVWARGVEVASSTGPAENTAYWTDQAAGPQNYAFWAAGDANSRFDGQMMLLGGTTNAFPALKRSGNMLQIMTADGASNAPLMSYDIYTSGNITFLAGNNATITAGATTPEGRLGYPVGSLYLRSDGIAGATLYVKETGGTTNIGWTAAGAGGGGVSPDLMLNSLGVGQTASGVAGTIRATASITGNGFINSASSVYVWQGRSYMQSLADGNITLNNNAGNDFGLLQFGGTTGSYPALRKMSGSTPVGLEVVTANVSTFAPFGARYFVVEETTSAHIRQGAGTPESVVAAPLGSLFLRDNGAASTSLYVKESGAATSAGWRAAVTAAADGSVSLNNGLVLINPAGDPNLRRWKMFVSGTDLAFDSQNDAGVSYGRPAMFSLFNGGLSCVGPIASTAGILGSGYSFATGTKLASAADGVIQLTNNASSDFSMLQFGGTTVAFPAFKRSGTTLTLKLADDTQGGKLIADQLWAITNIQLGAIYLDSPADGQLRLRNSAGTDFSLLQFGGTTAAFPALQRSGPNLVAITADASALSEMRMGALNLGGGGVTIRFGAGTPEGVLAAPVGSLFLRTDGAAGTTIYAKETGAATTAGWKAVKTSVTHFESHTWGMIGDLTSITATPSMFVAVNASQAVRLASIRTKLASGTSVGVQVKRNGTNVGTVITVTSTVATTSLGNVVLADNDEITLTLSAPVGSPTTLSATILLEHTL
jgi:hypothetical protein